MPPSTICPLGGVWEDQQLPLFILGPPSYLRNTPIMINFLLLIFPNKFFSVGILSEIINMGL